MHWGRLWDVWPTRLGRFISIHMRTNGLAAMVAAPPNDNSIIHNRINVQRNILSHWPAHRHHMNIEHSYMHSHCFGAKPKPLEYLDRFIVYTMLQYKYWRFYLNLSLTDVYLAVIFILRSTVERSKWSRKYRHTQKTRESIDDVFGKQFRRDMIHPCGRLHRRTTRAAENRCAPMNVPFDCAVICGVIYPWRLACWLNIKNDGLWSDCEFSVLIIVAQSEWRDSGKSGQIRIFFLFTHIVGYTVPYRFEQIGHWAFVWMWNPKKLHRSPFVHSIRSSFSR